jgi:hypothetical protein
MLSFHQHKDSPHDTSPIANDPCDDIYHFTDSEIDQAEKSASEIFASKERPEVVAKNVLSKIILHGRPNIPLTSQEQKRLDQQLLNAGSLVNRLADMIVQSNKNKLKESLHKLPDDAFNNVEGPITVPSLKVIRDTKKKSQLLYAVHSHIKSRNTK